LDENGEPTGKYGRLAFPAKGTESDQKPYFEPVDKNGTPLNQNPWDELNLQEQDLRKKEELDTFKNSDKLRQNIKDAQEMQGKVRDNSYAWMRENFPKNAKYDLKEGGRKPQMEHAGNFNYGAMGKAARLSDVELKAGGGYQQLRDGTWKIGFIGSYFDDPVDQGYIQDGIDWYDEV
jgi:hypothetical protein